MLNMLDLIKLIRTLRPDLCKLFPINTKKNELKWLSWLITNGVKEYQSIRENKEFQSLVTSKESQESLTLLQRLILEARPDVRSVFPLPESKLSFLQWFYTHGIEEHQLWPWLSDAERDAAMSMSDPWPERLEAAIGSIPSAQQIIPFEKRVFGVNLIGYVFGQLGIGEDVRMIGRAMLAAGVPFTMIDFPPGADIPQNDRTMEAYVSTSGEYGVNLFCMTALENGRFFAERGNSQFCGCYNIGHWPWELSKWPLEWESMTQLVDEVWVYTQHTYDALAPISPVPVYIMSTAVELGEISDKERDDFGLPLSAKLFCFSFDLNSSIHRKNPQACVDAFLMAFPIGSTEDVGLVIKVHPPKGKHKIWEKLKALAEQDKRIYIIESTLSRPDLLALYACCDCFLSLHRAEGFGRGIAEALQLGLHIITTGYSGNVSFCHTPNADLVNYKLIKVKKNQYPFADAQVWADADVGHAAELMKRFAVADRKRATPRTWDEFSPKFIGERYKKRLEEIYFERGIR